MAFPTGWTKKCSLTIDNTKVSGSANLTNFPVLLTEANFPSTIFDNTQSAGQDLRFSSDSAGTTELAFEIVNWDTTNDKAEVWVKVTTVDCDGDTTFYVWYGNSSASAYAEDATYGSQAVWADYEGVWHLTNANDSSANGYDLTPVNSPTTTSGLIGTATTGAYSFTHSSNQELKIVDASCPNLDIGGSRTVSCWAKSTEAQSYVPVGKDNTGGVSGYQLWVLTDTSNKKIIHQVSGLSGTNSAQSTPGNYPYNVTYFIVGTYDSSAGKVRCYVDGTKFEASASGTGSDTGDFVIGNRGAMTDWNAHFSGPIDEVRVRDTAVSDDWVVTEYANQSAPATFVTEGEEEDVGSTGIAASKRSINC